MFKVGDIIIDHCMIVYSCKEHETYRILNITETENGQYYEVEHLVSKKRFTLRSYEVKEHFIMEWDGNDILKEMVCTE